ncbi:uncharacterized protein L969DRAFT_80379 [Mixia osmundae IAM 14324]|uniref:Zn(2)-C6 fungal-type domain-containing protein n=1 Tax=Mixia osmundae (strain CBS 9802 / IAM 14324 / JCM 22182 / KY 12970) TaxID=764103 RepID=G7E4I8_MIXOS|nr:uncharacterized protein L969DRAFT_80379 [Mixia osmundae IAM 14324]KEI36235.1 hypothetical protein L969DRAFT_80379 [Mixia osmundae IAM 14324]GAA97748.1 hypothetical protein E5Q_04427 [Mixia osmundae IAM 14324]
MSVRPASQIDSSPPAERSGPSLQTNFFAQESAGPSTSAGSAQEGDESDYKPRKRRQPALSRFEACKRCRARKVRCDTVRPACGPCLRSANAQGIDVHLVMCEYDKPTTNTPALFHPMPPGPPLGVQSQESVRQLTTSALYPLEQKIASLEHELAQYRAQAPGVPPFGLPPMTNVATHVTQNYIFPPNAPISAEPPFMNEMLYPAWPPSLPSPPLVISLCTAFFSKPHVCGHTINRGRFLSSLNLLPTHPDFPHTCLIHAVCCVGSMLVSPHAFNLSREPYWQRQHDRSPADYHARVATETWDNTLVRGAKLFHVAQAMCIICYYTYSRAKFVEVWLWSGVATRLCTPLGLNNLQRLEFTRGQDIRDRLRKTNYLAPTTDRYAHHERAETFWMSFLCDRFASANTGWASAIDEADVTTLLPAQYAEALERTREDVAVAALSIHSSTFFTSHPDGLVGPRQLNIKAFVLLGRVVNFVQRLPAPFGHGEPVPGRPKYDYTAGVEFNKLDAEVVAFRLSFPPAYRHFAQALGGAAATIDIELVTAHAVPHCCTMILHEPFVSAREHDLAMRRCLLSARAMLAMIQTLRNSSFELGLLTPYVVFCWSVAGRTLIREFAIKTSRRLPADDVAAEVNLVIQALELFGMHCPLGNVVAQTLRRLFADHESCIPKDDAASAVNVSTNIEYWRDREGQTIQPQAQMEPSLVQTPHGGPPHYNLTRYAASLGPHTPAPDRPRSVNGRDLSQILFDLEQSSHSQALEPGQLQSLLDHIVVEPHVRAVRFNSGCVVLCDLTSSSAISSKMSEDQSSSPVSARSFRTPAESQSEASWTERRQDSPVSSRGPLPILALEHWTVSQVERFFAHHDLAAVGALCTNLQIDGSLLAHLGHDDLKELGILSVGTRLKILRAVYDVKIESCSEVVTGDWSPPCPSLGPLRSQRECYSPPSTPPDLVSHDQQLVLNELYGLREEIRELKELVRLALPIEHTRAISPVADVKRAGVGCSHLPRLSKEEPSSPADPSRRVNALGASPEPPRHIDSPRPVINYTAPPQTPTAIDQSPRAQVFRQNEQSARPENRAVEKFRASPDMRLPSPRQMTQAEHDHTIDTNKPVSKLSQLTRTLRIVSSTKTVSPVSPALLSGGSSMTTCALQEAQIVKFSTEKPALKRAHSLGKMGGGNLQLNSASSSSPSSPCSVSLGRSMSERQPLRSYWYEQRYIPKSAQANSLTFDNTKRIARYETDFAGLRNIAKSDAAKSSDLQEILRQSNFAVRPMRSAQQFAHTARQARSEPSTPQAVPAPAPAPRLSRSASTSESIRVTTSPTEYQPADREIPLLKSEQTLRPVAQLTRNVTLSRPREAGKPRESPSHHDTCFQILPLALKKYNLRGGWQEYVLFIQHDGPDGKPMKRCLSYNERPREIFDRLKEQNANPVFSISHLREMRSPVAAHGDDTRVRAPRTPPARSVSSATQHTPTSPNAIVVFPHTANKSGQISLDIGERCEIIARDEHGSVLVRKRSSSNTGLIPLSCLLELKTGFAESWSDDPEAVQTNFVRGKAVIHLDCEGEHEVGLRQGEQVRVYCRAQHWLYVGKEDKTARPRMGWTPAWLVELLE